MCRLALFNKKGAIRIEEELGLANYFKILEDSRGGHGNGFALLENNKVYMNKGIKLTVDDIAEEALTRKYEWFIFHTRLASKGKKTSKNCHPFRYKKQILAMNGTERDAAVDAIADKFNITDTEAVLRIAVEFNIPISEFVKEFDSVFIGFEYKDGVYTPFASCSKYRDIVAYDKDGATIIASEFPYTSDLYMDSILPKIPFSWKPGDTIEMRTHKLYNTFKGTNLKGSWYEIYKMNQIEEEEKKNKREWEDLL